MGYNKFLCLFLFVLYGASAQNLRSVKVTRISDRPIIDGVLNDSCWKGAEIATDFIQNELHPGIASVQRSEVKIVYDDDALYISAQLYDSAPDSVLDRKSTRLNSSHSQISYAVFCLKKKKN